MPLRVLPERRWPADWSLPGHWPAQLARCLAVGKTLMSVPISAMITSAAAPLRRRGSCRAAQPLLRKGRSAPRSRRRAGRSARRGSRRGRGSRRSRRACSRSKRPSSASLSAGSFARSRAAGELGEHLGVGGAVDQRVEHRPAGDAEDVGRDAVELDPGVLERLVQPVGLPRCAPGSASCDSASGCAAPGSAWAARSSPATARPRPAGTARPRPRRRSCGRGPA